MEVRYAYYESDMNNLPSYNFAIAGLVSYV